MSNTNARKVWFNGNFIQESEAKISIYDSALMFGDMVFEMTRSFNKKQFKLREHLERLYASTRYLQIPFKMTIEEMQKAIYETIEINDPFFEKDDEYRVMIDISRGLLSIYENTVGVDKGPNIIIAVFPLRWTVVGMGELFETGINAVIPSQRAIPASLLDPKVKNRSRIHYLKANMEVSNYSGNNNWALLLDPDGFITEGTGDNFFIIKGNAVISPEGRNILRGISRQYVIDDLCVQSGFDYIEKNIEPYDVLNADEAFMTGTPFCMLPVTHLNSQAIGKGEVGSKYKGLLNNWSKNTGVDIKLQIQDWNKKSQLPSNAPSPYQFKNKCE